MKQAKTLKPDELKVVLACIATRNRVQAKLSRLLKKSLVFFALS